MIDIDDHADDASGADHAMMMIVMMVVVRSRQ